MGKVKYARHKLLMAIFIQSNHIQQIRTDAEQAYPEECCGLMLGKIANHQGEENHQGENNTLGDRQEPERIVIELWPVTNAWDEDAQGEMAELREDEAERSFTAQRRYWIDPKDMLAAQKYSRTRNLHIIGIYHSHPDHPAIPSECDRVCAWPEYSYIIVSVPKGQGTDVLSWVLDTDHQFQSESLIMSD